MKLLLLILSIAGASALLVSPVAARAAAQRVAASPLMACNGGKGGKGGMSPKKDKGRRGQFKALLNVATTAEDVNAVLLTSQTESLIMKMNWKVRKHCKYHLKKRAAELGVDVPAEFAGFHVKPLNTPKSKLVATFTEASPINPKAVAALAKLPR